MSGPTEGHLAGDYLDRPGAPLRPLLVVAGWAAEQHTLADGRRQLLRLSLQGEVCGLGARSRELRPEAQALTDVTLADLSDVEAAVRERRADQTLAEAWRKMESARRAGDLRQLVRLGSLSAAERAGNLLLELYERSAAAGLTHGAVMSLPLTQIQLASYLGLSPVHANRVLQQLRREGLIEVQPRQVVFRDLAGLASRSFYDLSDQAAALRTKAPPRSVGL